MVHVPYRGAAPALTGLVAGDVQMMFMTPPSSMPYVEAGKIRAIGYAGTKRFARLPDVPTLAEAGVPGMEVLSSWTGMFAPAKTPPAVLARLHEEVRKAVESPFGRERLTGLGVIPVANPSGRIQAIHCRTGEAGRRHREGGRHRAALSIVPKSLLRT